MVNKLRKRIYEIVKMDSSPLTKFSMHNKMIKIKYQTCDHLLFKGSEFLSLKLIYCLKTTNLFGISLN
jgi:peroxiredoxin family protein